MCTLRPARVVIAALLAASCATLGSPGEDEEEQPKEGVSFERGAVILTGTALEDGSGSVLAAMRGKVPSLRVQQTRGCPEISLRNYVTYIAGSGYANPHVYVDGTRATDTCILESLRTNDVQRVEVYPQGVTRRPGYGTHAPGLILVFMRSAG